MNIKLLSLTRWTLLALLFSLGAHARAEDCLSGLPDSLRSAVEQDHWKILSPFDIPSADWKLWKNAHQGQCPGVAVGNFFPKTNSSSSWHSFRATIPKNLLEKVVLVDSEEGPAHHRDRRQPGSGRDPVRRVEAASRPLRWNRRKTRLPSRATPSSTKKSRARQRQFYYQGSKLQSFVISN